MTGFEPASPVYRFLAQKLLSVARVRRHRDTETQTDTKVTTVGTLSGFQEFFLQPIINDRPNIENPSQKLILLSDNMFDYIVRLLVWAVEGEGGRRLGYRHTLYTGLG